MEWFKHYHGASTNIAVKNIIGRFGVEGYGHYMLLLELLCEKMDNDCTSFVIHKDEILSRLKIKQLKKLEAFSNFLTESFQDFPESSRISVKKSGKFSNSFEVEAPILLLLKSRDFKKARHERAGTAPKKEEIEREIEKEIELGLQKIILSNASTKNELKPERILQLFNSKLAGVGKIKASPGYFLPSGLLDDFKNITGFPEFDKLETWDKYFNLVASSTYLTTQFTPSLAWLLKADNAFKVLGGQYQDAEEKNKKPEKIPDHVEANASSWAISAYKRLSEDDAWYGDTDFDWSVLGAFGDLSEIRASDPKDKKEMLQKLKAAYFKINLKSSSAQAS